MQKLSLTQTTEAIIEMVNGFKSIESLSLIESVVELQLKEVHKNHVSHKELSGAEDKIRIAVAKQIGFLDPAPIETDGTITYTQPVNNN